MRQGDQAPLATALRSIPPGARVVPTPYCATPDTLLRAVGECARTVPGLTLVTGMLLGSHPYAEAVREGRLALRSWHVTGPVRRLAAEGLVSYVPCRAGDVPSLVARAADVALLRVCPPDRHGNVSLGPSASYGRALIEGAAVVIGEVDESLPRTTGDDVTVHRSHFDHLVASDTATPTYDSARPSPTVDRIVGHVVGLLPDEATVQLGIGAVPEGVATRLTGSGHRIIGLVSDPMAHLVQAGGPPTLAVELMGTERLFAVADGNPGISMVSSRRIHNPAWLARLPRFVSVCSALQVDLSGQVASESVGGVQVAGIGGSADFVDGAHLTGGLRIVALPATTASGASRIVSTLDGPVTLARHAVDAVVTEFGVAHLSGRSIGERAEALAAIAGPEHRAALNVG